MVASEVHLAVASEAASGEVPVEDSAEALLVELDPLHPHVAAERESVKTVKSASSAPQMFRPPRPLICARFARRRPFPSHNEASPQRADNFRTIPPAMITEASLDVSSDVDSGSQADNEPRAAGRGLSAPRTRRGQVLVWGEGEA